MKGEALIFMLFSWLLICSLSTFCFTMLLTHQEKPSEKRETFISEEEREEIT
ncbi:hypothetical protein [Aquifex aeolicus]|uniref:hypothetical protein n=1 Tax=Aquifex aeolicus TaxID=63363 RepID=UPI000307AFC6|nr:hypothetical protein [Aquifex aeolicus]